MTAVSPPRPSPVFGRRMRDHWALDPAVVYLNHGTVGAPPRRVLEAQQAIRDLIERQPSRFLLRELSGVLRPAPGPSRLRAAADEVADFLGARGGDLVFVENATTGVNAVLRSWRFAPGDEILITDHAYGAVANAARHRARECGARVRIVELPLPAEGESAQIEAIASGLGPHTRLAIVDHVTSESAWILPLSGIAARCREAGVAVLADGAHAPGALALDVPALGVDWYAGNLHKWAYAPRSCGILWADPSRQGDLHPPVISWGLDQGFVARFDWTGTRDPSAYLAAPAGIAFMRELGVDAVREWNHRLAWEGAQLLVERWRTEIVAPRWAIGTMATVPLPARAGAMRAEAERLRDALLFEDGVEVQLHAWRERLWVRISAQVYNDLADIECLADAVSRRI